MVKEWKDKILYWSWEYDEDEDMPPPPTKKRIAYVEIQGIKVPQRIACGVWDDDKYTSLNTEEINWWVSLGGIAVKVDPLEQGEKNE